MHLVVVHKSTGTGEDRSDYLLRMAFNGGMITDLIADSFLEHYGFRSGNLTIAVPGEWKNTGTGSNRHVLFYDGKIPLPQHHGSSDSGNSWHVITNGRFFDKIDVRALYETISQINSDVVTVCVEPHLKAGSEKVLIDSNQNLVGIRLLYADAVQLAPIPSEWPNYLFIQAEFAQKLFKNETLPDTFNEFLSECRSITDNITGLCMGGLSLDLNNEEGLLSILMSLPGEKSNYRDNFPAGRDLVHRRNIKISPDARLVGQILLGRNVTIGANVIVAGPAVIADNANISANAVIRESIIGPSVSVPEGIILQNRVISESNKMSDLFNEAFNKGVRCGISNGVSSLSRYRIWPRFSYARCVKRIADAVIAAIVLIVFAPVLPFIALAVKLDSKGPVFFKAKRQGLHGKPFACFKFRTMLVGADAMQEKLRTLNEADGPQFVIADDPRLSRVGRFLRETYIDEIPQFLSILLGRMSLVGPRPSPESENVLCPFWRDARLSVRPGLTGLWQVCRTRRPMKDFQEWIQYDIEYVRNLSMGLDLQICFKTAKKMLFNFVRQF